MTRSVARFALAALALAVPYLTGCQAPKREPDPIEPRSVPIFAGDASGVTPWDRVVEACAESSVVVIGEVHGHPLGLAIAAELYEDILTQNPRAVLSMEFYERDHQTALDDYVAGIISSDEFDRATFRNAGNNPEGHRRMVEATRLAGRPIIGANAPRRYARLARTDGFDRLRELRPSQRRHYQIPDALPENAYGNRFRAAMSGMGGHGQMSGDDPVTPFLRAQTLWDVTMAESIAEATRLGEPVVHVVGRFHAEYGTEPGKSGLADAIAERIQPDQRLIIITIMDTDAGSLRVEDVGRGHFVIYVGPLPRVETN
ncbi:MAG: ChaN family lipoprotein [Phycisphaerales bacterium]|nr:ChaN family lipoprotein [Planctomycetota bacterium]MCH8508914.1 ChaN family lipoprotein [Phycisphaerales bacterium]